MNKNVCCSSAVAFPFEKSGSISESGGKGFCFSSTVLAAEVLASSKKEVVSQPLSHLVCAQLELKQSSR